MLFIPELGRKQLEVLWFKSRVGGGSSGEAPLVQTLLLMDTADGAVLHWTHSPGRALLAVLGQLLAVINRGNPERTRAKPSMCKNTPINASGHFGPEKLKSLKPKESQVSTITGRGFHGQHFWRQLPEICFKVYQSPRFFTGFNNRYWNKITAGIYSVNWIQSILKILLLVIKLD